MPDSIAERLMRLRAAMQRQDLAVWLVPRADPHLGEHIPSWAERLSWISGFTGSAGLAAVARDCCALFVDGRYTIQARRQCIEAGFSIQHVPRSPLSEWLKQTQLAGAKIGFDSKLHSISWINQQRTLLGAQQMELVSCQESPLDMLAEFQPLSALPAPSVFPIAYSGRDSSEKRHHIAAQLRGLGLDGFILTQPESVAWLFNIRGQDVPNTPIILCWGLIESDGSATLFLDPTRIDDSLSRHLGHRVSIVPEDKLGEVIDGMGQKQARIGYAGQQTNGWIVDRLAASGCVHRAVADPSEGPRARKNWIEISGMRRAHQLDGIAMCRFLAWLQQIEPETYTESQIATRLDEFRAHSPAWRGPSFPTISGMAENGAVVHYRAIAGADISLRRGELLLLDSGGQYDFGTTDVTRTVLIDADACRPDRLAEFRRHFCLVLRGHIALARARFPYGTTGKQLDTLARWPLWQHGLEYDHGTGHGVGCYLAVHEGPQRISPNGPATVLEEGMVVSNEPGYYRADSFGIRIENLILVGKDGEATARDDDRTWLSFETLSLAPIDRNLIDPALLAADEMAWLNRYHTRVLASIGPFLDENERDWLVRSCEAWEQS